MEENENKTWRSMETAPKDGTEILVCMCQRSVFYPPVLRYGVARWSEDYHGFWDSRADGEPIGWYPLPPLPPTPNDQEAERLVLAGRDASALSAARGEAKGEADV